MIAGETVYINGTGDTSRDFCFVENVVQMNISAAITDNTAAVNQVYNVAVNSRISPNELSSCSVHALQPGSSTSASSSRCTRTSGQGMCCTPRRMSKKRKSCWGIVRLIP